MSETKEEFKVSENPDKLIITITTVSGSSTTITTNEHDKYQYLSNLSSEKQRNITQIATLQARNIDIDNKISAISLL